MLGQKIRQEELSPSVLNNIWEEVDTEHRLAVLTNQLDNCVAFIGLLYLFHIKYKISLIHLL